MDTSNRTFVSSVLFLDIVEYSKCSVTEQMQLKQRFNTLLVHALRHVAVSERIVLDTGDGAAVSFLGNPEDALFAAMSLRDGLQAEDPNLNPKLGVRLGINLGPVRLIKDINGQLNIIGDGINVAQRIMSFSDPGAILVSRSYYEVVSRLSDDYARIFSEAGMRTDKHVREHAVYAIGDTAATIPPVGAGGAGGTAGELFLNRPERRAAQQGAEAPAGGGLDKRLIAAVAGIAVLLIGAAVLFRASRGDKPAAPAVAQAETAAPAAPAATPPESKPEKKSDKKAEAVKPEPKPEPRPEPKVAAAPVPAPKAAETPAAKEAKPKTEKAEKKPADSGAIALVILPWGDVYMDGKKRGVSPPLKSLTVAPGQHNIMIKNTDFPPHIETIEVKAGATVQVRHKF